MIVFGITGGTGAGKTTVCRGFEKLGVRICDCDVIARRVTRRGTECLRELERAFGGGIVDKDGNLLRRRLGAEVFADSEKLAVLNKITHKYITLEIEKEIERADCEMLAIDGAVIIGSPVQKLCSVLVVVTADEDVRIERVKGRDGLSDYEARGRIRSQMSEEEYLAAADYIITNNDNEERLGEQIEQIYRKIKDSG